MGRLVRTWGRNAILLLALAACSPTGAEGTTTTSALGSATTVAVTIATTSPATTTTASTSTTSTAPSAPSARPPVTSTTTSGTVTIRPDRPVSLPGVSPGVSDSVVRLHVGLLGRQPTRSELRAGVERYRETGSFEGLVSTVLSSAEYEARRPGESTDEAFVDQLYADVLGRRPDQPGATAWRANLAAGMARAAVAAAFVQSPEAVVRTRTAPPEPPPPPRGGSRMPETAAPSGGVLAVGDSIMLGAAGELSDRGMEVDAAVSRQFGTGVEIVRSRRDSGQLPGTVVVHLGTNGDIGGDSCDALMDLLAGRRVVIVTLHVPRSWKAGNNALLRDCALRHGAGLADWSSVAARPGLLAGDGYHLNAEGATAFAELVAGLL